jgi:hypothetical protein
MIRENEVIWFVHLGYDPPLPLRLQRTSGFGAEVVGGKTGSHVIGHGETYWDKLTEIIKLGYMPVSVVQELGQLDDNWIPPNIETLDFEISNEKYRLRV